MACRSLLRVLRVTSDLGRDAPGYPDAITRYPCVLASRARLATDAGDGARDDHGVDSAFLQSFWQLAASRKEGARDCLRSNDLTTQTTSRKPPRDQRERRLHRS
jgi:hypothetical protein